MCVDYRDLNALTEQDAYPLPRIDDILHRVAGSKDILYTRLAVGVPPNTDPTRG